MTYIDIPKWSREEINKSLAYLKEYRLKDYTGKTFPELKPNMIIYSKEGSFKKDSSTTFQSNSNGPFKILNVNNNRKQVLCNLLGTKSVFVIAFHNINTVIAKTPKLSFPHNWDANLHSRPRIWKNIPHLFKEKDLGPTTRLRAKQQ